MGLMTFVRVIMRISAMIDRWIPHPREVLQAWLRVEFIEQAVTAWTLLGSSNFARLHIEIAEDDRASWARFLASGLHRAIRNRPIRCAFI